jgi:hypothetical protein
MLSGRIKHKPSVPKVDWQSLAHGAEGYAMISNPPGCEEIISEVLSDLGGSCGVVFLSRIVPGQEISVHVDGHDDGCRERVHVPLKTNNRAFFIIGGKKLHMRRGQYYVIDPTEPHGVINEGKSDRIHLMFNVLR